LCNVIREGGRQEKGWHPQVIVLQLNGSSLTQNRRLRKSSTAPRFNDFTLDLAKCLYLS
jgi:hypothetical protein